MDRLKIWHLGERGQIIGEGHADSDPRSPGQFLIPAHAAIIPPLDTVPDGQEACFDAVSQVWYMADIPPEPVQEPAPVALTPEQQRAAAIRTELDALDRKSIRALRTNDSARLDAIEAQAVALRAELAALGA